MRTSRSISVILPTFNRCHYLPLVIEALLKQEMMQELIIVDDCSSDATRELLAGYGAEISFFRVIRNPFRKGSAYSRNVGLEAAKGESVFMMDDDVVMGDDALTILNAHRDACGASAASSRMVLLRRRETPETCAARPDSPSGLLKPGTLEVNFECLSQSDLATVLTTPLMLILTDSLLNLRYDIRLRGNAWREETDFQIEYARRGGRMVYCPHAVGYHLPPKGGGQRSGSRVGYELSILRNNYYFFSKHAGHLHTMFPDLPSASQPLARTITCAIERAAEYAQLLTRRLLR